MKRLIPLVLLAACAHTHEDLTLDEAACEAFAGGDLHAVTASPEADDDARAEFHVADHLHVITMPEEGQGWIRTTVDADRMVTLYASEPDLLVAFTGADGGVDVGPSTADAACPEEIPASWTVLLPEGTWYLELNDVAVGEVLFMAAPHDEATDDHAH